MRFIRNFEITIQTPNGIEINITPPITARISITRNTLASANSCSLSLVNLKKSVRAIIYKDRFAISDYWQMVIRAGYGRQLYEIFRGNIYEAFSSKSGTDWVTQIEGMDGMYAIQNGVTSRSYNAGVDLRTLAADVVSDMPRVIRGVFSPNLGQTAGRGTVLFGSSSEILEDITNNQYFIDGEQVNILGENQYIEAAGVLVLDAGIRKATPRRRESLLEVQTLFTPQVVVKGFAEIRGGEDVYAGQYLILGFSHNITISQAEPGQADTMITLDAGTQALEAI